MLSARVGLKVLAAFACGLSLAACGALPAAAPTSFELINNNSDDPSFDYSLVTVDARVAAVLERFRPSFGPGFHGPRYVANNRLHPGDAISITVYETGGSTLFPPPSNKPGADLTGVPGTISPGASTIPPQAIERDGTVNMPFVGRVPVAGKTPAEAARLIEEGLAGKAVNPQVVVTPVASLSQTVTVSGDVNTPRYVQVTLRGEKLLEVIAAAGGSKFPPYETYVRVVRGNNVASVLLQTIINNPSENISMRPGDQIYLTRHPRSYAVLGAAPRASMFIFDTEKVTMAEAVAKAGGPADQVGDPAGVYLFRFEPWFVAKDVLPPSQVEKYAAAPPEFVPILYNVRMREAEGFFVAQAIQIRDKDVVLITNAPTTQLNKVLVIARGFSGIAEDVKRFATNPR
jgi:polysaccharide export outer membrane protein